MTRDQHEHARSGRRMVIYARISDDREGRMNGVERQEKQCRALADRNGDEVVKVFIDDDRSAYSRKPRPDYIKMLAYLRDGHADGVYALAPTRLYRRLNDGLEFFELINTTGLKVETVKQGRYDLSTADGRRDALRAAVDAQYESELIGERTRDAKAENLTRGEFRGGPRPFGYEADGVTPRSLLCPECAGADGFTIDRECRSCGAQALNTPGSEMWHIEAATDAVIAGESLRGICRTLSDAGSRTVERRYRQEGGGKGEPESREWYPQALRKMLMRARNAGLIEHYGEVVGRGQWAPAVTEEKWRACVGVLDASDRRTTPGTARVWLLSGLARCRCGETLTTSGAGNTRQARNVDGPQAKASYRCRVESAGHVYRQAVPIDRFVVARVLDRLSRPDAADLLLPARADENEDAEDLAATANALRAKLDSIAADYAKDLMTRKQMLDATALTRERLEQMTTRMEVRRGDSVLAQLPLGTPQVAEEWESYHLDRKRAIVDALMTVTLHPARRGRPPGYAPGSATGYFDERSVAIDWKQPG